MDKSLAVAVRLVDGLTALDVAVCLANLKSEMPYRRFPALDEQTGEAFLDFEFSDGDVASKYVCPHTRELCAEERKAHMAAIARCITEADIALAARPRGRARAVIRVCKNKTKVMRLAKLVKEAEGRDVDFSFIRAAVM